MTGQKKDLTVFSVAIGEVLCKPTYTFQYVDTSSFIVTNSILKYDEQMNEFVQSKDSLTDLVPAGPENDLTFYFPKRADTVIYHYQGQQPQKVIKFTNNITISNVQDSICKNQIDQILGGKISVLANNSRVNVVDYTVSLLYLNGDRFEKTLKTKNIKTDKETLRVLKRPDLIYIGIYDVNFRYKNGRMLSIYGGHGWKIKNCQ